MEFGDPNAQNKRQLEAIMAAPLEADPRPTKRRPSNPAAANQRHIKTEQARRDKIAAGFQALQDLLPGRERVEKALLLTQAANYITELQAVLSAILTNGTITSLPDDLQWQIRSLLPRKDAPQRLPGPGLNQGAAQASGVLPAQSKEMSKDENVLMAQVQAQISQMQQQAAAAQQLQSWQQALQAFQLQQVLSQQQQHGGAPDIAALANFASMAPPTATVPVFKSTPSAEAAAASPTPAAQRQEGSFTELLARDPTGQAPADAEQAAQQDSETAAGDSKAAQGDTQEAAPSKSKKTPPKNKKQAATQKAKDEPAEGE